MNKLVAFVALALIVGGFLLVTFSYASPTGPTGTNGFPDISDITHGTGRPDPPNDYVPSTPPVEEPTPPPETTPPPEETPPPETTPPPTGETYVTKYFIKGQTVNGGDTYDPAQVTVTMNYPVAHHHVEGASIKLISGASADWYIYGATGLIKYGHISVINSTQSAELFESSSISSNEYTLRVYGICVVEATFYCTEWPSSSMSIFGSSVYDMTIGVVMLIAGFACLLLFGRH